MKCDQCSSEMIKVGRQIRPGIPDEWMDGWVCRRKQCNGHAVVDNEGSVVRWPALTLADQPIHSTIRGAMKFRDEK